MTQRAQRFGIAVQREEQSSEITMGGGTGWVMSHGVAKCVQRLIEASLALKRVAEAIPGIRIISTERERHTKCCFSLGIVPLFVQQVAQVVVSDGKPRVERNRPTVRCFRLVVPVEGLQRSSQVGMFSRFFVDGARSLRGMFILCRLLRDIAEGASCAGGIRVSRKS